MAQDDPKDVDLNSDLDDINSEELQRTLEESDKPDIDAPEQ